MAFSDQVKYVRSVLGQTQKQLAENLDVTFATVNRWENSKAEPSNLARRMFYDYCESSFIDLDHLRTL